MMHLRLVMLGLVAISSSCLFAEASGGDAVVRNTSGRALSANCYDAETGDTIWYLEHQVTFLGALIGFAGLVGVFAPSLLYVKAAKAIHKAQRANSKADVALKQCDELLMKQYVHRGKHHYVQAKHCYSQVLVLKAFANVEDRTSEVVVRVLRDMLINFCVQMIVNVERAIAYSHEASYCDGLVADLKKLQDVARLIDSEELAGVRSKIHHRMKEYLWVVPAVDLQEFLREMNVGKRERQALVDSYEDIGRRFGRFEDDPS